MKVFTDRSVNYFVAVVALSIAAVNHGVDHTLASGGAAFSVTGPLLKKKLQHSIGSGSIWTVQTLVFILECL